ncbi:HAD-like protein [Cystobasidium minutum MCA 4210]|uniref:HAD-like protein n=1 Tax=Cystobasidium minutum MCA 4210 TaxID=1397322 RepID=UPI0034CDB92F|eukprot:jgi/Rhomi1/182737/fgenesh1_pm.2_\
MSRPQIKACIFDMDGLMINSESVYTLVTNELLAPYGKEVTWELKKGIMGRPGLDAARYLVEFTGIPMTPEEAMKAMEKRQEELFTQVTPMPGVLKLVAHLATHNIPIAIATGSRQKNFELKTSHLPELFTHFPKASIVTADTEHVKRGKPHPDIFLYAAETLNITSEEDRARTLVFEDGIPGVKAAVAAGMPVVWVPDEGLLAAAGDETIHATQRLTSLDEFKPEEWGLPAYDEF